MNRVEYTFKHAMPVVITVFRNHDFIGLNDNHAIPIIQFPQILYVILSHFLFGDWAWGEQKIFTFYVVCGKIVP